MDSIDGRESSEQRVTRHDSGYSEGNPLKGWNAKSNTQSFSTSILESFHFSMLFSLADGFREEAIENAEPALANNLRNLRDHDVGIFSEITSYIGHGATFSVRRTMFPDSKDVVFKSRVPKLVEGRETSVLEKIEAILLELRVLTHAPLRNHENIVKLVQIGWEGDALDRTIKWPVLIVDYADRGTLADFFETEELVTFPTKKSISLDISRGLRALHDCKIMHGDLKLLNVLVYSDGERRPTAKLSDFGGALLDSPETLAKPMGTPPWTAPEYGTLMPRAELLKSDVYALGLLIWRVMLSGDNPFRDESLFNLPPVGDSRFDAAINQAKLSDDFLVKAKISISNYTRGFDYIMVSRIFEKSIQVAPNNRDLDAIISCLQADDQSTDKPLEMDDLSEYDEEAEEEAQEEEEEEEQMRENDDTELRLSLAGLDFQCVTRALSSRVLESLAHTAQYDHSARRKADAAFLLARMHLGAEDFGLPLDIDKGLHYLTISAEAGCREDQALMLRMHNAFYREVPDRCKPLVGRWLLEAAATGSMTALEDMLEFGYKNEYEQSLQLLKTRYCGLGEEIFDFEEEAFEALVNSFDTRGREYILTQLEQGKKQYNDLRGYFLRLSAAYGSSDAIEYLVSDLGVDVNDQNDFGDSAILFAARSGHRQALITLLQLGANPRASDEGGDTAMHWLCSFDDEDIDNVLEELVRKGADLNAQAGSFPIEGRLEYAETEFVAGTPLHRAICRNKRVQVQALLRLGANPHAPAGDDIDETPIALAALLHYPQILHDCLSFGNEDQSQTILTPTGRSLLIPAIVGGSVNKISIGRLMRHGAHRTERAIQTLSLLCEAGASEHLPNLPGMPGCTAVFYASRYQAHIIEWLIQNGGEADIDRISERPEDDDESSEINENSEVKDDMRRPPLFEAILYGKSEVVHKLLDLGADAQARENDQTSLTALHQCAVSSFEDISVAKKLCEKGLKVDDRPEGYETPFQCAVRNGCYVLAQFLRDNGADVNVVSSRGLLWRSSRPQTLLCLLARNNSSSSISGIQFLLDGTSEVSIMAEPSLKHTIFHILSMLDGDSQDGLTTSRALDICKDYFAPLPQDLNAQSLSHEHGDSSIEATGGNTALHYAVIHANFQATDFLLRKCSGVDTSVKNAKGFTALDLATLSYPTFEKRFTLRKIPKSPARQLEEARTARDSIMLMLSKSTPGGVSQGLLDRYSLDGSETET